MCDFDFLLLQVILELLRYISHVPLLLPHMTTKTTTINNYLIPKGTQVGTKVLGFVNLLMVSAT